MKNTISNSGINLTDILFDLKSILGDYFIAQIDCDCDGILLHFYNGQQFFLSVEEK